MRYVFNSGYCFSVPGEGERELISNSNDSEYLKLGVDRIPAIDDIKIYKGFDREGKLLDKNTFVIEEIKRISVEEVHKVTKYEDDNSLEDIEAVIKVKFNSKVFKRINAPLWEKDELSS